jgi:hypothetical protein
MDRDDKNCKQAHCIVCHRPIEPAVKTDKDEHNMMSWEMPSDAVLLMGGDSFGSTIYDSLIDGIDIQVIVCDKCLEKAKVANLIREINVPKLGERALQSKE